MSAKFNKNILKSEIKTLEVIRDNFQKNNELSIYQKRY